MAAPIHLKANTPGGNSYSKSVKAQKNVSGKAAPAPRPKVRPNSGKKTGDPKAAYSASNAIVNHPIMGGNSQDYASSWMQSKGLKNAQNDGVVGRLPYASVPADKLGSGSAARKGSSSSATTKSRVKATYTGKSYATARKSRRIGA